MDTAWLSSILYLFSLLIALVDPPFEEQKRDNSVPWTTQKGLSTGTYFSASLRSQWMAFLGIFFFIAWTLPTLIVVNIALTDISLDDDGFDGSFASGSAL